MSSLQALINAASSGATINLSGNYTDSATVMIDKPLTIVGRTSGSDPRPSVTVNTAGDSVAIIINASNVTLKGIDINHNYSALGAGGLDTCIRIQAGGVYSYPDAGLLVNTGIVIEDCRIQYGKFGISSLARSFSVTGSVFHNKVATATTARAIGLYGQDGQVSVTNNTFTTAGNNRLEGLHFNFATNDGYVNKRNGSVIFSGNASTYSTSRKFIFFEVGAEKGEASDVLSLTISNNVVPSTGSSFMVVQPNAVDSFEYLTDIDINGNNLTGNTHANGILQIDATFATPKTHNAFINTPIANIYNNTWSDAGFAPAGTGVLNLVSFTGFSSLPANYTSFVSASAPSGGAPAGPTTTNQSGYGGAISRGTVVSASNVGPANSVAFTSDGSNSFSAVVYSGVQKTLSKIWVLLDTTSGLSAAQFPTLVISNGGVNTTYSVASSSSLSSGQGAYVFYGNLPTTELFRYATRRSVSKSVEFDVGGSIGASSVITVTSPAGMTSGSNFNVYSIGYQFTDGSATELQFVNDDSAGAVNIVGTSFYHASDVTNKFSEMADLYNEDGVTHFTGRIYDDANLRTNMESVFNQIITKVPNILNVSDSVTIIGTLNVSATGQPVSPVSISVQTTLQYLELLLDQSVTVSGTAYDGLSAFDASSVSAFDAKNILREEFITSFLKHTEWYFTNVGAVYPTAEINNFIKEYFKPIRIRARMMAMAALTGTNTVAVAGKTNTLYLRDIEQGWAPFSSLKLQSENLTFESAFTNVHPLGNYQTYIEQTRVYERTLTRSSTNWTPTIQDPFTHGKKFLSLLNDLKGSTDLYIQKLLQVWNLARVHNHAYDGDALQNWNGSTVDALQLELYSTYGYGNSYTWLSNADTFMGSVSEPDATSSSFITQNLLDRVLSHLRLDDFAGSVRPNLISDSYERLGWVTFVDAFMRYYFWSATNANSSGSFTAEQSFIGNKATFFRAYDASLVANPGFTTDQHILEGAKAVLTTSVGGVFPEANAFQVAFSRIRAFNSSTFWSDLVNKRLNHLPYHVVWHQTENMVEKLLNASITQSAESIIAVMNNIIDFYPKTTSADAAVNSSIPARFDWYRIVGYLAAVPQELPAGTLTFGSEIGFGTSSRASFPFVGVQTASPKTFFDEMTRRLFFFHRCDHTFAVSGSLNSSISQVNNFSFNPDIETVGLYDPNTDSYTSGYRGLFNINNYYLLLKKENDIRLAISSQESEYDLEDLVRVFNEAISQLNSQTTALETTNSTVQNDISSLENIVANYHDPYSNSDLIDDLQLRYVQVASENRAQDVLKTTYNAFATLITEVKTKSDAVSSLQVQYQTKLNDYNTKFDSYIEAYNQWNNLVDSASNLIESTTSYVDLLRARITLTAEVAQLRAKFNSDVTQIKTTVAAIQQTYLNLKAQGIRTIPTSSTSTTVNIAGVNYQKRSQTTFPIVNLLNFVPK